MRTAIAWMSVLVASLGLVACGDDDPCHETCSVMVDKMVSCFDSSASESEVDDATSACNDQMDTTRQGISDSQLEQVNDACVALTEDLNAMTCAEYEAFLNSMG